MSNTVTLHRVLAANPAKVFRAFTTADAMARWIPPDGFTCKVHHMDVKVGGTFRMTFVNFTTQAEIAFGGEYREIIEGKRLVYTDVFDDPNLAGEMVVTINLQEVSCGTDLKIVQSGIPALIPVEHCYLGWQQSLAYLAKLVEPNID